MKRSADISGEKSKYQHICHEFGPVFDENSRILILGSLPSVKSREQQFYYGHPQNRFWKVMTAVCGWPDVPGDIPEKRELLLGSRVALWDVIAECDIIGSSDSSIRNVIPNNLSIILDKCPIEGIFVNGGKAYELYMKYDFPALQRECVKLPSTSPANAAWSVDRLIKAWGMQVGVYMA